MNCSTHFNANYLEATTQALNQASRVSVQFGGDDQVDEDTASYLKELREEVLKAYTAVIIVAEDIQMTEKLAQSLQQMFDFIDRLL